MRKLIFVALFIVLAASWAYNLDISIYNSSLDPTSAQILYYLNNGTLISSQNSQSTSFDYTDGIIIANTSNEAGWFYPISPKSKINIVLGPAQDYSLQTNQNTYILTNYGLILFNISSGFFIKLPQDQYFVLVYNITKNNSYYNISTNITQFSNPTNINPISKREYLNLSNIPLTNYNLNIYYLFNNSEIVTFIPLFQESGLNSNELFLNLSSNTSFYILIYNSTNCFSYLFYSNQSENKTISLENMNTLSLKKYQTAVFNESYLYFAYKDETFYYCNLVPQVYTYLYQDYSNYMTENNSLFLESYIKKDNNFVYDYNLTLNNKLFFNEINLSNTAIFLQIQNFTFITKDFNITFFYNDLNHNWPLLNYTIQKTNYNLSINLTLLYSDDNHFNISLPLNINENYTLYYSPNQNVTVKKENGKILYLNFEIFDNKTNIYINWSDTRSPKLKILNSSFITNNSFVNISYFVWDDISSTFSCIYYLNSNNYTFSSNNGTNTINLNLTEGNYTLNLTCFDEYGNSNSSILNFTVDLNPPKFNLSFAQNNETNPLDYLEFNYSIIDYSFVSANLTFNNFTISLNQTGQYINNSLETDKYNITICAEDYFNRTNCTSQIFYINGIENTTILKNKILQLPNVSFVKFFYPNGTEIGEMGKLASINIKFGLKVNNYLVNISFENTSDFYINWSSLFLIDTNASKINLDNLEIILFFDLKDVSKFISKYDAKVILPFDVTPYFVYYYNGSLNSINYTVSGGKTIIYLPSFSGILVANDSLPPSVEISTFENNSQVSSSYFAIEGKVMDYNLSYCKYGLDTDTLSDLNLTSDNRFTLPKKYYSNGNHYLRIKCYDWKNNIGDYYFVFKVNDLKGPVVVSRNPVENVHTYGNFTLEIKTDEPATCKLDFSNKTYIEMDNYFETTDEITHKYKLSLLAGEHTLYILCRDKQGNVGQMYTISYSILKNFNEGIEIKKEFPYGTLALVKFKSDKNVDILINTLITDWDPKPTPLIYKYFEINLSEEAKVTNVTIRFRVSESWMDSYGLNTSTITLYKYKNGWTILPTKYLESKDGYALFEANTDSFSLFAIGIKPFVEYKLKKSSIFDIFKNPFVLGGIAGGIILVIILILRRRGEEEEEEEGEEEYYEEEYEEEGEEEGEEEEE